MTNGSEVIILNNGVRGGVTEVTFGKDIKFMKKQVSQMSRWRLAGHGREREEMSGTDHGGPSGSL